MDTTMNIDDKILPTHVDANEIKDELELTEDTTKVANNPKMQKHYTFMFSWKDGNGKLWQGNFTNKVLSIKERQLMGIMRARMSGGLAIDSIDPLTQELNLIIAHLTFSLVKRPKWASDLQALENIKLLQEIYLEVSSHEAMFLGYGQSLTKS